MLRNTIALAACGLFACSSTIKGTGVAGDGGDPEGRDSGIGLRNDGGSSGDDDGGGKAPFGDGGTDYDVDANTPATRPPPVITSVSPLLGDYGTLVTITGDNLDEASASIVLAGVVDPVVYKKPASGTQGTATSVIQKWSKTEIQFKYPFPAEGKIRVSTKSGDAEGGKFVPSWTPGSPMKGIFTRRELLEVVSPAPGTMVATFDGTTGPHVLVANANGGVASKAFARGSTALLRMSLYTTAAGGVEDFYDEGGSVWQLTDAMGTPTTTNLNIGASAAAGGRDATGPYAWVRNTAGQLVRVRPPTWAADGAPVVDPTPGAAPGPSIAVAPDHSLYAGWGVNDTGSFPLYDNTAHPVVARLRPGLTAFDASKTAVSGADDKMIWTRFRAGPEGRVSSFYCASDTGFGSAVVDCGEGYIGNGGAQPAATAEYVVGHNATVAHAAFCDTATATVKFGPENNTAQQAAAIYPCPKFIVAVTVDSANNGILLIQAGDYAYPRKR